MFRNSLNLVRLVCAALLVSALPFWQVLIFQDRALLYRDIARHFLPGKVYWARAVLADGEIPLWNYSSSGGMPFWAQNVNSPLHPLNFLFLLFPLEKAALAMNWFIYLHYPALLLGAYFLLRVLNWKKAEAFLFASALALSGTLISTHNLCHSLFSFTAVPWFFACWLLYLRQQQRIHLLCAALAIAWPIFAGDPQFSYFLGIGAGILAIYRGPRWIHLRALIALGTLSILCAGAQLFPLLEMISYSNRDSLSRSELLYFSFHPMRLLETLFPLFFGNHEGAHAFWGQTYVNFPFPSPFIFSTYPGALVLIFGSIGIFTALPRRWSQILSAPSLLCGGFLFTLFLSFGSFAPIPLYEFLIDTFPLFRSFRYPERLLFWVFFLFWALACWNFQFLQQTLTNNRQKKVWLYLGSFLALYLAIAASLFFLKWVPALSIATVVGVILLILTVVALIAIRRRTISLATLALLTCLEIFWVQGELAWDSSIYVTDQRRYPVIQETLTDFQTRQPELAKGAPRRYSSMEARPIRMNSAALTHSNFASFSAFDSATPNVASYYGFDDINAYFALAPRKFEEFLLSIGGEQFDEARIQLFFDLTGTYYRVRRNTDEHLVLEKRPSAIPYLFSPEKIWGKTIREEIIPKVIYMNPHKEMVVYPLAGDIQNSPTQIDRLQRDGKTMRVEVSAETSDLQPQPWILWNEAYHPSWQAYVGGEKLEVKEANGFSMTVQLPKVKRSADNLFRWQLEFRFESRWIRLGILTTAIFFLMFAVSIFLNFRTRKPSA
jgi:hypothetical protein